MNDNLIRTPIVDANGKPTHVWKGDVSPISTVNRLSNLQQPTIFPTAKTWKELPMERKVDHVEQMLYELFEEHDLEDWTIGYNRSYKVLGSCDRKNRKIIISKILIEHADSVEDVEDTVLHEVAHALVIPSYLDDLHDARWQRKAVELGAKPLAATNTPGLPTAPGRKTVPTKDAKDEFGNIQKVEVPVYIGDMIRAWDGVDVKIQKINSKNLIGESAEGVLYQIRITRAEQYKNDYEAVQQKY